VDRVPQECLIAAPSDKPAGVTIFANLSAYHAAPILFNLHASALLRARTGGALDSVEVLNHPFQRTLHETAVASSMDGVLLALTVLCACSFIPASIASNVVMENESGVKHQLLMSGCGQAAYLISSFAVDCIFGFVSVGSMVVAFKICRVDAGLLLEGPGALGMLVLLMLFNLAATSTSHLTSSLFSKSSTAFLATLVSCMVGGLLVTALAFVLPSLDNAALTQAAEVIIWFLRLAPSGALGNGALRIGRNHKLARQLGVGPLSGRWTGGMHCPSASAHHVDCIYLVGDEAIVLGLEAAVCFILSVAFGCAAELPAARRALVRRAAKPTPALAEDASVVGEVQRVAGLNVRTEILCVNAVSKAYKGGVHAVRGVSFAANDGEVLGLFGANGAGKSTILKMLCGELLPNAGQLHVRGLDAVSNICHVRKLVGYCPQSDPLADRLTLWEHLKLHGRLRGLSGPELATEVQHQIEQLDLATLAHVRADRLSNGNRRKLSVALASITEPPLVFLDEPSTGMDPVARRFTCTVVQGLARLRRRSVVLLATHLPDEVEALCSRIAIQANGAFQRIGPLQHVLSTSSQGFELSVRLVPSSTEDLDSYFKEDLSRSTRSQEPCDTVRTSVEALPFRTRRHQLEAFLTRELGTEATAGHNTFHLVEQHGSSLRYHIQPSVPEKASQSFAALFKHLEANQEELMVAHFQLHRQESLAHTSKLPRGVLEIPDSRPHEPPPAHTNHLRELTDTSAASGWSAESSGAANEPEGPAADALRPSGQDAVRIQRVHAVL